MKNLNRDPHVMRTGPATGETAVSNYDRYNAAMVATILVFGFVVALMLAWCFSKGETSVVIDDPDFPEIVICPQTKDPIEDDVLDPGIEDFPELEKLQLMMALESLRDIASRVPAAIRKRDSSADYSSDGSDGRGTPPGIVPVSPPITETPEHKRWQIQYECEDIDAYSRQLDFFDITLGLVNLNTNEILLVSNVSTNPQYLESNRREQSGVLRFEHRQEQMRRWDRTLARRSGVELTDGELTDGELTDGELTDGELTDGYVIVQFYPESTREVIRAVEAGFLAETGREPGDIRKTFF